METKQSDTARTSIYSQKDLAKMARQEAKQRGVTMTAWDLNIVREAFHDYVRLVVWYHDQEKGPQCITIAL